MYYKWLSISGKPKQGELIKNVQCGYDVRKEDYVSILQKLIDTRLIEVNTEVI